MPIERPHAFTIAGNPLTLVGPELAPGDPAPDFRMMSKDLQPVSRDTSAGKTRILVSVSSIDTPVCESEALELSRRAGDLPGVEILVVSVDQPFAQQRWCREHAVDNVSFATDHRDVSFGAAYGVLVKETRTLSRAAFVVDARDRVVFAQYLPDIDDVPDYDAVVRAAREAAGTV